MATIRRILHERLKTINMFEKTYRAAATESELYLQRQSTRVYFLLLLLALFILVVYTSLTYQQDNNNIKISSLKEFQKFHNLYASTSFECPCTRISFNRSTFHEIQPVFHQVCSSDFISNDWLNILFTNYKNQPQSEMNSFTFNGTAFAYFQSLNIMCRLTQQAVIDAQGLFLSTQVVSAYMLNYDIFTGQTTAAMNYFKSTIANSFVHTLNMLLGMAQGNGLVSGYSTNWGIFLPNMTKDATIYTKARTYGECNCATSSSCHESSTPYVPGFVVGCLPLESFLRSTFECLYNQPCVDTISSYINASIIPRALNTSHTKFPSNSITNDIVEQMFIESWSINISYDNFFQQCQPKSCLYTLIGRSNILYVITTIVGLYGGLTVLLKILVPFSVHRIHGLLRRRRQVHVQVALIEQRF